MKKYFLGISTYKKALEIITKHNMVVFFTIPLFLNVILFWIGFGLISDATDYINELISGWINSAFEEAEWLDFIKGFLSIFIRLVLQLIYLFIFAFIGGYLVMVLLSPLLAYLSERTEAILTDKVYSFNFKRFLSDVIRGIVVASRNFVIEMGFLFIFFIIGFVPLLNLLAPIALFVISAYFYGFSFMDYCNERRKPSLKEGVQFIRKNKMVAIGNGAVFSVFLLIPVIGVFLASFVSIISVVAGTVAYVEADQSLSS